MEIRIKVLNEDIRLSDELIDAADGDELIARIFYNRGYKDPETVRQMLHEEYYHPVQTWEFPLMDKAVARVCKAIEHGEKIAVYGDYDVDGVTSTVSLVQCLLQFTSQVVYHVPDRFTEGYGMNEEVVRKLHESGVSLIITCDCGISNVNEIKKAKELDMDVIITDHHNIPDQMPPADMILNPKLLEVGHRARNLSGCAMAYFLCLALLEYFNRQEFSEELLDMLALSLVADVVSLNGENRYLLKRALPRLFNSSRPGMKALFSIIEKNSKLQTEEDIAFQIAPRINAAGRMESARLPVELFLNNDAALCLEMALKIDFLNTERKRLQQEIIRQAAEQVENRKKNRTVLVLFSEFWHHGIIGIAAGKICEMYRKPAILLTMKEDGITAVGSARSVEEIDIYSLIKECSGKLLKFGGHPAAAGLSLKKQDVEEFTREIEAQAEKKYFIKEKIEVNVDWELGTDHIDEPLYHRLSSAGPYGEGFEAPVFLSRSVTILSDRKTEKNHHIMVLSGENDSRIAAVKWFGENESLQGKVADVTYKISRNTYRGNNELQLTLDHILPSEGRPEPVFKGNFIDFRSMGIERAFKEFGHVAVYFEGLESICPVKGTMDRYHVSNSKNLLFLSTPVNTEIFREVVSLSNPDNIIINFSILPDYSFKGFMMNVMGLMKHAANRKDAKLSIEYLASRLCIEENVARAVLKYLKALGKIEYAIDPENNTVYFYMCSKPVDRHYVTIEKNIKNALMEKSAYQQFVLKLDLDKFKEYLR